MTIISLIIADLILLRFGYPKMLNLREKRVLKRYEP